MLRTKLELKHGRRESKLEEFAEVKEDGAMVVASKMHNNRPCDELPTFIAT